MPSSITFLVPLDIPAAIGMDPENEEVTIEVATTDDAKFCRTRLQTLG